MTVDYSTTHATGYVSKCLATNYGGHIYNVTLTSAADNGNIIKRGDWNSYNNYEEAAATTFNGIIRGQDSDGRWIVEVLADQGFNALFVYNEPVNPEDGSRFKNEEHLYIEEGDVARAHQLYQGDLIKVSAAGFSGTPVIGASISTISGKKLVVGSVSV